LLLASLFALAHCGGPLGPPANPAPVASASSAPPPPPPAERVALDVFVDGHPAGHESWAVTKELDGTTEVAFDATLEDKGQKLVGSGSLTLKSDLTTSAGRLVLEAADGTVTGELKTGAGPMVLTLSRGSESREVKAEQPSNVFLPQPFFVGFAKLCPLLDAGTPALVEFPGSPLTVGDHHPAGDADPGVTVYVVERGALGKTAVACDKGELVAALDPFTGQSAARSGRKGVLDALVAATTRKKPRTPDGILDEEMSVTVPGSKTEAEAKLACSFMKPAAPPAPTKAPKLPAVAFFTGSGPQDRDEDTPGPGGVKLSIFKFIAIALAEKGIASIRCDDRGTGASTGVFEAATFGTFVRDGEAVVKALRARPDVDPARVGLIGHSAGGMVAPVVARAEGFGAGVKGVLLMATPGRPIPEVATAQQQHLLEQAGLSKEDAAKRLAPEAAVLAAIKKGDPLPPSVPPEERAHIESQRAWLKSHFDHDPQLALRQMPATSVLVVQGGQDLQVPPEEAELVRKGLASGKNSKAKVTVYPTLNHVFTETHGPTLAEYTDPKTQLDGHFLADVVAFFAQAFSVK
jgi:fermentation-respiration switch protein FrsA (DUF1100 family)